MPSPGAPRRPAPHAAGRSTTHLAPHRGGWARTTRRLTSVPTPRNPADGTVLGADRPAASSIDVGPRSVLREVVTRLLRGRPFPYPPETAGTAMALLYLVGGLTALLIVLLPHPATLNITIILVVGSSTPFVALAVWVLRHRLPAAAYHWLLAFGSAVITVLVAAAGSHSALVSTSFFYTWVVIYAVLFFPPLGVVAQIGATAIAYGTVLVLFSRSGSMDQITALEPIALTSVVTTTGLIVTVLSRARENSQIDPLTRVANRRGLDRLLDSAMGAAARGHGSLVVAMIDVDHFKSINDEGGHSAGDAVLEDLSRAWRKVLRAEDALARFGGDEFVAILPNCSAADGPKLLERLRTATAPGVTCSIGAATWKPGESASMLMSSADAALYQAKRLGRDRVVWADAT